MTLAGSAAAPQSAPAPAAVFDEAELTKIVHERVDSGRNAAIVMGVVDLAGARHVIACGAQGGEGSPQVDAKTVFEIGSATKTFTAALLAQMVAKGDVKLEDSLAPLLPAGTNVPARGGRTITLLDLATQSSGLPRLPGNLKPANLENPYADYTEARALAFLSGYELTRDPGAEYEYSNFGFGLLGMALAARAGGSYEQAVVARVLDPLGMKETRVTLTPSMKERVATGHDPSGGEAPLWDLPALAGAGALRSTLDDMMVWLAANMNEAGGPLGPILATTHGPRRPASSTNMRIGLAWHVFEPFLGTRIVWHNGGTGGFRSFVGFDRERKIGVVLLTSSGTSVDDVGMHVLEMRLPLQPPPAPPKRASVGEAAMDAVTGDYALAPGVILSVTREGSGMFVQLTGQPRLHLVPTSATEFAVAEVAATITFEIGSDGKAASAMLHQNGRDVPAERSGGAVGPR